MARKNTSGKGARGNQKTKGRKTRKDQAGHIETDLILVVKGAGNQAEDVHLNHFLRGFWPAVKSLDPKATIVQIPDEQVASSPHNEESKSHKHRTEIMARGPKGEKRRIWVKESYWEYEVLPSTPLGNLRKAWGMASFVFANTLQDLLFPRNNEFMRELRSATEGIEETDDEYPKPRVWDYIGNFVSYTILFLLLFLPFLLVAPYVEAAQLTMVLNGNVPHFLTSALGGFGINPILLVVIIAVLWALAPAAEISWMTFLRSKEKSNHLLRTLPGLSSWMLVFLILLLLTMPISYLTVFTGIIVIQVAAVIARRILWKYRNYANSDIDHAEYYFYKRKKSNTNYVGKLEKGLFFLPRLAFSPLVFRYFIFFVLPIAYVILIFAGFLKWTKIFEGIGKGLDDLIKVVLVGYMDDVVNYAMDPAQAHRVRSVVMNDIKNFHNLKEISDEKKEQKKREKEEIDAVDRIHIIAHSTGTPITFEVLFHHLETEYQKKIITYVTIGSILSYFHQARGVFDLVYHNRFSMPIRKGKDKDNFPEGFKWMNFWNFSDPATEFHGLDEYVWFEGKKKDDGDQKRGATSPVNVRTRTSLKNHGEYWENLDQLQKPFAERIMGDMKPAGWDVDKDLKPKNGDRKYWHLWGVFLFSIISLIGIGALGYLLYWVEQSFVHEYIVNLWEGGLSAYQNIFPPDPDGALQRFTTFKENGNLTDLWFKFVNGSIFVIAVWAALDWFGHVWRTILFPVIKAVWDFIVRIWRTMNP